jgi:glycerol-3-phosphate acyltransferase PlsY
MSLLSRPLLISLAVVSTLGVVSAAFFSFSGTAGVAHNLGSFFTN